MNVSFKLVSLSLLLIGNIVLAQTDALTILPNGNVGVGTTTPAQKLEVNGNIQSGTGLISDSGLGDKYASFSLKKFGNQTSNYALLQRDDGVTFLNSAAGQPLYFMQGNKVKMVLDPNGNFGIGNTTSKIIVDVKNGGIIGSSVQPLDQHDIKNRGVKVSFGHQGTNFIGMRTLVGQGTKGTGNTGDIIFDTWEWGTSNSREVMRINGTGNVGIGTSTPTQAKLVVYGNAKHKIGDKFQYFGYYGTGTGVASGSPTIPYSIYATDRIAAQQFNAFSDARIKQIIGRSNPTKDLETLSKIEITDYKLIDVVNKGNKTHKKVIAQQLKEVFPQAVTDDVTEVIPNIYQLSTIKNGWIALNTDKLAQGNIVKLIFSSEEALVEVLEIKEGSIKVASDQEGQVFVYGKQVNDFHTVDYEAISMLNVSATQALLQRIEKLEEDKKKLSNDFEGYKTEVDARLLKLERSLQHTKNLK